MGEAKRRKKRGDYPRQEMFEPGPITVEIHGVRAHFFIDRGGRVHRIVSGGRIRDEKVVAIVQDAARKREIRIVRPADNPIVRP